MSTEHVLIEKPEGPSLAVLQSGFRFTLELQTQPETEPQTLCELTEEDLVRIARHLIQIASYQSDEREALLRRFNLNYATESLVVR